MAASSDTTRGIDVSDEEGECDGKNIAAIAAMERNTDEGDESAEMPFEVQESSEDEGLVETACLDFGQHDRAFIDTEKQKVATFDCKCKIRVFTGKTHSSSSSSSRHSSETSSPTDTRVGCVAQFSPEQVLAKRLHMAELNESKLIQTSPPCFPMRVCVCVKNSIIPPDEGLMTRPKIGKKTYDSAGEKDTVLLKVLSSAPMNTGEITCATKPCRQKKREHRKTTYIVDSKSKIVCRETFRFIHGISQNKLTAVLKHYNQQGVTPRQKKWGGRKNNTKSLTPEDTERVAQFLHHFGEDHALVLSERVAGSKRKGVKSLLSVHSKAAVWRLYHDDTIKRGHRAVGKSSFYKLWQQHVPSLWWNHP